MPLPDEPDEAGSFVSHYCAMEIDRVDMNIGVTSRNATKLNKRFTSYRVSCFCNYPLIVIKLASLLIHSDEMVDVTGRVEGRSLCILVCYV
jgi:hypothetical protein